MCFPPATFSSPSLASSLTALSIALLKSTSRLLRLIVRASSSLAKKSVWLNRLSAYCILASLKVQDKVPRIKPSICSLFLILKSFRIVGEVFHYISHPFPKFTMYCLGSYFLFLHLITHWSRNTCNSSFFILEIISFTDLFLNSCPARSGLII